MSFTVSIVLKAFSSLFVFFKRYHVLHIFEVYAWISTLIALVVTLVAMGKKLSLQADVPSLTVRTILTFGSIVASLSISWTALISDFSVCISPTVPKSV